MPVHSCEADENGILGNLSSLHPLYLFLVVKKGDAQWKIDPKNKEGGASGECGCLES